MENEYEIIFFIIMWIRKFENVDKIFFLIFFVYKVKFIFRRFKGYLINFGVKREFVYWFDFYVYFYII